MRVRTRLLSLATATLLCAPAGWAGAQSVSESRLPVRLSATLELPSDTARQQWAPVGVDQAMHRHEQPTAGTTVAAQAVSVHPASSMRRARTSLARRTGWGAAIGAAAGALTGLTVLAMCDSYCDDARGRGLALHVGVGAALGGAVGALIHHVRD